LEKKIRSVGEETGETPPDLPEDISTLKARCQQVWEEIVPGELKPKPKRKRRKRPPRPVVDADQPFQTGRIKTYIDDRGFGFIVPDDGGEDVFFHITNVEDIKQPKRDMLVEYQVTETPKGLNAVNVRLA
jgi:CspA family cold shock protein